ncbi:hypothetical protein BDBG_17045, partial [Blastomyces gilchristii SLH14081]
ITEMNIFSSQYKQHSSLLSELEDMQNLLESLLKVVRKAAEITESESKLCMCTRILNKIKVLHIIIIIIILPLYSYASGAYDESLRDVKYRSSVGYTGGNTG